MDANPDDGKPKNGISNGDSKKANPLEATFTDPPPPATDDAKKVEYAPVSFFRLYKYTTRRDHIFIVLGIIAAIITGLCTPANTILFGRLVDAMVAQGSTAMGPTIIGYVFRQFCPMCRQFDLTPEEQEAYEEFQRWFLDEITMFAVYNSILGAITLIGCYVSVTLFNFAAHNQIYKIRGDFFKSVLNQDIEWYDTTQSGEFSSRMNEDLTKLEDGLGEKVVILFQFIVAAIASMVLAFVKGWLLALVCLTALPLTMISIGIVGVFTSRLAKQEMEMYAKAGTIAEEVFSAIRTVVAFGGKDKESRRYNINLRDAKLTNIKKGFFGGLGFGLLWFFIYASYALAFWFGVGLVLEQRYWDPEDIVYTAGTMMVVFFSVMMGSMYLGISSPYIESIGIAKGAAGKVYSIIEQKPKIDPLAARGERPQFCSGNVTLKNVFFNYPSRPDVKVLRGVTLSINKGETVALVGSSGCGKSTCIQLIQRFYDPDNGEVLLDGRNIKDLDVNWVRSKIGVVGQEPVLFGTTIYENIMYGNEAATEQDVENAAKASNAHFFITRLPNGYNTLVGERGAQMSGGQKQRIAIARALVRNPDILLLDEATSALDLASEAKVQAALEKASVGRTTIVVAHRLSTIRNADKIIVLKNGEVVESGNHDSLMLLNNHYYNLVTTQMGSAEKDGKVQRSLSLLEVQDEDAKHIDIIPEEEDDTKDKAPETSIRRIMKWNQPEWPYITLACIMSLIMGAAMPLFGIIFGEVIGVLAGEDKDEVREQTNMYSLYFLLVGILVGVATFVQIYTFGVAGERLTERIRGWAFESMINQEMAWFDDKANGVGTLCARLSTDASAVQGATGQRIGTVLQAASTLVLSIVIAMYYEWRLGLVALSFTPFLLVASYFQIILMAEENLGNAKSLERSTKLGVEAVSNIRTVVSIGKEKMFYNKYIKLLEPSMLGAKKATHIRAFVFGIARSLMFFAYAACMAYGGQLVYEENLDIGVVFVVSQVLIMGTVSIANVFAYAPNFQKGIISAAKIEVLLNRQPQVLDPVPPPAIQNWQAQGDVEYEKSEFFYPSRPSSMVLNGLDLQIHRGQTVALVGPSGCGKSTTLQLLERFYDCTGGRVTMDGKGVTEVMLKDLRSQMGIVSQEPSLFDRTIAENIAYGDNSREVPMTEIVDAAKSANIHNFISTLPLGYETRLGDKGTQLSGGQKQRVAIARALVRKPKILLLDEATSALDTESEKVVQDALDAARAGRTCITIAHRLTTIVDSDVIYVFDNGVVAEKGTHQELLARKKIYYKLYSLQTGVK